MELTELERPVRPATRGDGPDALLVDVGDDFGALIVYTSPDLEGEEVEISPEGQHHRSHNVARRRLTAAGEVFACVFPSLAAGRYDVWEVNGTARSVEITGGSITELR
jgi:hypothetical protein